MSVTTFLLLLTFQAAEARLPVTVRCVLDTELPLPEITVSLEEKREVSASPKLQGQEAGTVTLADLPSGDLHLLFYRNQSLIGRVKLTATERGEFIRLRIRLVEGNAILLDELRIQGVSEMSPRTGQTTPGKTDPKAPALEIYPPASPSLREPSAKTVPEHCPAPGEPVTLKGKVVRVIDNDSFELQSGPWTYVIYIGSSTRMGRGSAGKILRVGDLGKNQALLIRGTVAAGPDDECSIGASRIEAR
jgi:hypothetical protein